MKWPRKCCICGGPVKSSGEIEAGVRLHHDHLTGRSFAWHVACEQPGWPHLQ